MYAPGPSRLWSPRITVVLPSLTDAEWSGQAIGARLGVKRSLADTKP